MKTRTKRRRTALLDSEQVDRIVVAQAADESAWEAPIRVRRSKTASVLIPGELAARAAFLARLHRESRMEKWVERVLRERIELEEIAFTRAKKELAARPL